jgi:CRP-like cAMP-binding protein
VDEMHAGDFLGEMSLVDQAPRSATVTASTEMRLLVITADEFHGMLEANPPVAVKIRRTIDARRSAAADPGTI